MEYFAQPPEHSTTPFRNSTQGENTMQTMSSAVISAKSVDEFNVRKHTVRVLTPQEVDLVGGGVATWVYGTIIVTTIACTVAASMDGTETATATATA